MAFLDRFRLLEAYDLRIPLRARLVRWPKPRGLLSFTTSLAYEHWSQPNLSTSKLDRADFFPPLKQTR